MNKPHTLLPCFSKGSDMPGFVCDMLGLCTIKSCKYHKNQDDDLDKRVIA